MDYTSPLCSLTNHFVYVVVLLGVKIDGCFHHPHPSCHQTACMNLNSVSNHYVTTVTPTVQPPLSSLRRLFFLCLSRTSSLQERCINREGGWWMAACFSDELGKCIRHLRCPHYILNRAVSWHAWPYPLWGSAIKVSSLGWVKRRRLRVIYLSRLPGSIMWAICSISVGRIRLLMMVFSHPGHGNARCCIVGNWTCFSVLKTFHLTSLLIQEAGVAGFKPCVGVS